MGEMTELIGVVPVWVMSICAIVSVFLSGWAKVESGRSKALIKDLTSMVKSREGDLDMLRMKLDKYEVEIGHLRVSVAGYKQELKHKENEIEQLKIRIKKLEK
jgi:peptidoglycan hydrolase CwlO-like protein